MPANKKPRKTYRPKPKLNTLIVVGENIRPVASHTTYLLDLRLKNSSAMAALLAGHATKKDMDMIVAMSNITYALQQLGFGKEHDEVATQGRIAIISIAHRATKVGRFVPTGPEIKALNELMELHDAQMDVITVKDMDRAIEYARRQERNATRLPTAFLNAVGVAQQQDEQEQK